MSKDKEEILALAENGVEIQRPEDIIKDTYTLEFLNLPEEDRYSESDLEQCLMDNLQKFLLELGKGFAFWCYVKITDTLNLCFLVKSAKCTNWSHLFHGLLDNEPLMA